jgi:hypothetical protein
MGEVRKRGEDVVVRTYASPMLVELGGPLPEAIDREDW